MGKTSVIRANLPLSSSFWAHCALHQLNLTQRSLSLGYFPTYEGRSLGKGCGSWRPAAQHDVAERSLSADDTHDPSSLFSSPSSGLSEREPRVSRPLSTLSREICALGASTWAKCTIGGVLLNEERPGINSQTMESVHTVIPESAELELVSQQSQNQFSSVQMFV